MTSAGNDDGADSAINIGSNDRDQPAVPEDAASASSRQGCFPALPATASTDSAAGSSSTEIVVDGYPVRMDKLGPIVVNVDGSMSRISNWHEMSEHEQKTTMRVIGRRNQQRLSALQRGASKGAGDGSEAA